jgi:salicylate hydroxylase
VEILDGFDERIVQVARELDLAQVTSRSVFDIDPLDTWHTDSVTLLGDAAHAMLHHQGQGANSAILDAEGLAQALVKGGSVKESLDIYEAERKPLTDELQRISRLGWNADAVDSAFPANQ